jgi:hypothetical protein
MERRHFVLGASLTDELGNGVGERFVSPGAGLLGAWNQADLESGAVEVA